MRPKWLKMVPKRAKGGKGGSKRGRMGERKGKEGETPMNSLLAHRFPCENGLLSTLSGKGWTKNHFLVVLAHNVKL